MDHIASCNFRIYGRKLGFDGTGERGGRLSGRCEVQEERDASAIFPVSLQLGRVVSARLSSVQRLVRFQLYLVIGAWQTPIKVLTLVIKTGLSREHSKGSVEKLLTPFTKYEIKHGN